MTFLKKNRPEHHRVDPLKERGVKKESSRQSRSVFSQPDIWHWIHGTPEETPERLGGARKLLPLLGHLTSKQLSLWTDLFSFASKQNQNKKQKTSATLRRNLHIKLAISPSQYSDTEPTSPSASPVRLGAWQSSNLSTNFKSQV